MRYRKGTQSLLEKYLYAIGPYLSRLLVNE
jgi:hypothetical protein